MTQPTLSFLPPSSSIPLVVSWGQCLQALIQAGHRPLAIILNKADTYRDANGALPIGVLFNQEALCTIGLCRRLHRSHATRLVSDEIFDAWIAQLAERLAAGDVPFAILTATANSDFKVTYVDHPPTLQVPAPAIVENAVAEALEEMRLPGRNVSQRTH